ncbi:MAG TPA: SPOR domain-containing protein [Caulobacteraceae bacterium]|nr:SPOR domain-containing protein [Caulobacteraceae bacterium]
MSDHERGAYSPQTDAPLAFDARQSRGGGGFPTTLVISLVVLVVLIGAIVLFYRSGIRGASEGPGQVGAPVDQIKSPAPAGAQPSDQPATGLQIYKTETQPAAPPPAPTFAAPPEQPQARPAAPVQSQALPAPQPAPAPQSTPATAPAATSTPAVTAKSAPMAATAAAAGATAPAKSAAPPKDEIAALLDKSGAAPATPSPTTKAAAPAKPVKPPTAPAGASGTGTTVQIGAYSSEDLAVSGWNNLATAFPADMTGKGQHFEPVKTADGKTLYRATVSGFGSHAGAVAFCAKLKAAGRACIVK